MPPAIHAIEPSPSWPEVRDERSRLRREFEPIRAKYEPLAESIARRNAYREKQVTKRAEAIEAGVIKPTNSTAVAYFVPDAETLPEALSARYHYLKSALAEIERVAATFTPAQKKAVPE